MCKLTIEKTIVSFFMRKSFNGLVKVSAIRYNDYYTKSGEHLKDDKR